MTHAEREGQGAIHFVPFDLGKIGAIPDLVRDLRKEFGSVFGLVNNAAVGFEGALGMMHNGKLEEMVRVNTLSPIVLTKYVVRSMMADGAGSIVNVASIIGFTGYSGLAAYAATKSSMIGFTRSLAREVGRFGITVNAVAPGFLATDMTQRPHRRTAPAQSFAGARSTALPKWRTSPTRSSICSATRRATSPARS